MVSLKDTALSFKGKKDITDLDKIPVDIEIKEGSFEKNGQKMPFQYFELNGWKYTIKSGLMTKIQQMLSVRPGTKSIKVQKGVDGELFVVPLD